VSEHPFLIVANDFHDGAQGQTGQIGDGLIGSLGVKGNPLADALVLRMGSSEIRQDGRVESSIDCGPKYGMRQFLKALASGVFDLGIWIVGEGKENRAQLDGLEGQGTASGHATDTQRGIGARILFRLGRKLEPDAFRLARVQGLISPKEARVVRLGQRPPHIYCWIGSQSVGLERADDRNGPIFPRVAGSASLPAG
jgi:hypothetical protein